MRPVYVFRPFWLAYLKWIYICLGLNECRSIIDAWMNTFSLVYVNFSCSVLWWSVPAIWKAFFYFHAVYFENDHVWNNNPRATGTTPLFFAQFHHLSYEYCCQFNLYPFPAFLYARKSFDLCTTMILYHGKPENSHCYLPVVERYIFKKHLHLNYLNGAAQETGLRLNVGSIRVR